MFDVSSGRSVAGVLMAMAALSLASSSAAWRPGSAGQSPGGPPVPPGAESVVRFDVAGDRTIVCAATGEPDLEAGSRVVPATGLWLREAGAFRRVAAPPGACDPVWSPDARSVAFTSPEGLWVLDVAEGDARLLLEIPDAGAESETEFPYVAFRRPRWSPNGARIAYLATNGGTSWVEVVEVVDGRLRYRSPEETYDFSWGADSRSLRVGSRNVRVP